MKETFTISTAVLAFASVFWLIASNAVLRRRVEQLTMLAVRDALTGVFNRHYLQSVQMGERIGLILVDIDHFKPYNDTWGHAAGDALLHQFARLMERVVRDKDIVCRFGGEEFVIVLPDASWELVRHSAERLRAESQNLHLDVDGRLPGGITISVGIAISPVHGTTIETLLASADRALYAAKSGGRDRVAIPPHQVIAA